MILYHGSYCKVDKPNNQICILNQKILDKYLVFDNCEVIANGSK